MCIRDRYTIYTKDANGCVRQNTIGLNRTQVSATILQANVGCYGDASGTITISGMTGGQGAPYSTKIDSGAYQVTTVSRSYTGKIAGTYTVYVKDSAGCVRTYSVTITQPTLLTVVGDVNIAPSCYTASDGQVSFIADGGTSPYTYSIDGTNYQSSYVFTGLTNGNYTGYVKDANGCIVTIPRNINKPAPNATFTLTPVTCYGGNDGKIVLSSFVNGSSPYSVSTNGGASYTTVGATFTYSGLTAGTYSIKIQSYDGCIQTYSSTITQPTSVTASIASSTNPTCSDGTDGIIVITGGGGVGGYTYAVDGSSYQASATFTGLTVGSHNVYVKDSNGCVGSTTTSLTKAAVNATITVTNPDCNAGTGTIDVSSGTGGSGTGYQVKNGSGGTYANLPVSYTGLASGSYTIYIKDNNGCTQTYSKTITIPTAVAGTFSNVTFPTCYNGSDGSITITGSDGTPNASGYKYQISSNGGAWSTVTAFKTSHVYSGLTSGSHSIYVLDNNSCYAQLTYNLTTSTPAITTATYTDVSCNGLSDGSIAIVSLVGGNSPRMVSLDNSTYYYPPKSFTGLATGNYTIYVKDATNCVASYSHTISQPATVTITVSSTTNPTCFSAADGSINIAAGGGTAPFTYSKDGTTYQSSYVFTGLTTGSYPMYVKDTNNCTATTTVTLTKAAPNATMSITNPTCYGNTGSIAVSSGTGGSGTGYQCKIGAGGTYATLPQTYASLTAGTYTIYIKDSVSCEATYSKTITVPSAVTVSNSVTYPSCYNTTDGSVTVTASGGSGTGYQYRVDGGTWQSSATFSSLGNALYYFEAKDGAGCTSPTGASSDLRSTAPNCNFVITNVACNGNSNGSIATYSPFGGNSGAYTVSIDGGAYSSIPKTYTGLTAGTYTIRVKDSSGCVQSYSKTVTQPTALSVSTSSTNPTCYNGSDGSTVATGSGGTTPYTYSKDGSTYQSSATFTGLTTGGYTIYIKDANNCTASTSTTLSTTTPNATIAGTNPTCGGGTGSISVSSGNDAAGTQSKIGSGGTYATLPQTYSSLTAGSYTIYIKNSVGCEATYSVTITVPSSVTVSSSITYPSCYNTTDGSVTLTGAGGSGSGYQYRVDGNAWQSSATFSSLGNALYYFEAKDGAGCTSPTGASLDLRSSAPNCTRSLTALTCNGSANGVISTYSPNGGHSGAYTVSIDGGTYYAFPKIFSGLTANDYTIRVKDSSGCVAAYTSTISQPAAQTASITNAVAATAANNDGSLTITSTGGTWNKTYRLYYDTLTPYTDYPTDSLIGTYTGITAASPSTTVTGLACGYYWLQVTDANGCISNSLEVEVPCPAPVLVVYKVELAVGGHGTNSTNGTACYNYNTTGLRSILIYTPSGFLDDPNSIAYNEFGALFNGHNYYYSDGINEARITATGAITLVQNCTGGPALPH